MKTATIPAPAVIDPNDETRAIAHRVSAGRRLAGNHLAKVLARHIPEAQAIHIWQKAQDVVQAQWNLEIALTETISPMARDTLSPIFKAGAGDIP